MLDASTLIAWILQEDNAPEAEAAIALLGDEPACAPVIWWYEVRNVLAIRERRGLTSSDESSGILEQIAKLQVEIDRDTPDAIMSLARRHGLTIYDAAYLELALRRALPLATLDRGLARAAAAEKVAVIGAP